MVRSSVHASRLGRPIARARARLRAGPLLFALALAPSLTSCTTIRPWQRGTLAQRCMAVDLAPAREAGRQHVLAVREGATSADGARGGGCGCD